MTTDPFPEADNSVDTPHAIHWSGDGRPQTVVGITSARLEALEACAEALRGLLKDGPEYEYKDGQRVLIEVTIDRSEYVKMLETLARLDALRPQA